MKLDLAEYLPRNTVERSVAPLRPRRRIPTLWAAGVLLVVLLLLAALLPFLISAVYVAAGARLLSADSAGNPALAAAYFERAHEWSPADPEIDRTLARAYLRLAQPQAAITVLERAYQRRPESLLIQQELAHAYETTGYVQPADALWAENMTAPEQMVEMAIGVDGQQVQRVVLGWGDHSWETTTTVVDLDSRYHTVNVWFLNDAVVGGKNRDTAIAWVRIEREPVAKTQTADVADRS